ncbi:hypothetical protein KUTeg_016625 [Tegillarca granosa]|uniref:CN hydrolase domain-containing protein n=1 Tax=Tegillarca granosa TaxID=220873 RepID=A0ABQ9ELL4_TEGGR|nr:hypothetical protein KUTeg_016625 [Tegillarca granosa]
MDVSNVLIFCLVSLINHANGYNYLDIVKVAVYEHNVTLPPFTVIPVTRDEAVRNMMENLKVIEYQAKKASDQMLKVFPVIERITIRGAKLLVLPEDGLYGYLFTRRTIYPYLEQIPDPKDPASTPCPTSRAGSEVQCFLSRLAMETAMFIVANMGDKQPCNKSIDTHCPLDGHYQYNTDVIYNPSGKLIAKYHKYNLFYEPAFDVPNEPEIVTFETPFGLFGVFTCFDILFHDPPIELIQNKGVRNIVFPTAWFDALPHLSAVGFHSAFAVKWEINLLAANIHHPKQNAQGSGIYSIDGFTAYTYDNKDQNGRLLVSSIPILKSKPKADNSQNRFLRVHDGLKTSNYQVSDSEFKAPVFHDIYDFVLVSGDYGKREICQKDLCCSIVYNRTENKNDLYAFGAFDGLHTYQGTYYLQVCTLLKCQNTNFKSCGVDTTYAATTFEYLKMTSTSNGYIYPEVMLSNNGMLELSNRWNFTKDGVLSVIENLENPLLSASLISRVYSKDKV